MKSVKFFAVLLVNTLTLALLPLALLLWLGDWTGRELRRQWDKTK